MKITFEHNGENYTADLNQPLDISISAGDVKCFHSTDFRTEPYTSGDFVGAVKSGAPVNFFNVQMNPHGNGTHTECLGHITEKQQYVSDQLKTFHFVSELISVELDTLENGDRVVNKEALKNAMSHDNFEALIIRTLPNSDDKLTKDYSGTNPPYLTMDAMRFIVEKGVRHLLLDLPSVDREIDNGVLAAHHIFWNVKGHEAIDQSRADCTVTELVFVPNEVNDGLHLLNIQIPTIKLDAAPSKPVLYKLRNGE